MGDREFKPLLGTFELALFMAAGVKRFPVNPRAARISFLVPIALLFFWVYPLHRVPTEILGERGYGELVLIHGGILAIHLTVFLFILWAVARQLGKAESFWPVVTMNNFCSIAGFVLMLPLFAMVIAGRHTWEEIFNALILISFYELALTAYVITRGMNVPWQFGTGLAFVSMFIANSASTTVFALAGIG